MLIVDIDKLREWIGRSETVKDVVTPAPLRALAATLDRADSARSDDRGVPPLWHWLYFLPAWPQSEIGADGHPHRGGFLPPVPLPRRMWAGGSLEFLAPLETGQLIQRRSVIENVRLKEGRTGPLVFVTVEHEVHADGQCALRERQDIVYRDAPAAGEPAAKPVDAPADPAWSRDIQPDPVLLFRYSALTFNGHRIHYDRPYAVNEEGYPGLVVHGPLTATLLLDLLHGELPEARVRTFTFRAMKPLFDTAPFSVCGRQDDATSVRLWARTPEGHLAMEANATLY